MPALGFFWIPVLVWPLLKDSEATSARLVSPSRSCGRQLSLPESRACRNLKTPLLGTPLRKTTMTLTAKRVLTPTKTTRVAALESSRSRLCGKACELVRAQRIDPVWAVYLQTDPWQRRKSSARRSHEARWILQGDEDQGWCCWRRLMPRRKKIKDLLRSCHSFLCSISHQDLVGSSIKGIID